MPRAKALSGSLLLVLIACGGTEPSARVVADIKANGADRTLTVIVGATVAVDWGSENATSCLVTPAGWTGTTGSETVEAVTATTTYRLSCAGPEGEAEDTVHVEVTPVGTEIVFQAGDGANADIYIVNADGSGLIRLTDHPDADLAPTWSADGLQIYFLSHNREGRATSDLYAMNPDGTGVHLAVERVSEPYAVSPEGTRIAVGAVTPEQPPENVDLFVMNADGSGLTLIADLPCDIYRTRCEHLDAVAWSPDGRRIAYSASWPGHAFVTYSIVGVVNADGTGQQILSSELRSTDPAWAPDGQRIVFSSTLATASYDNRPIDLEIVNADGTGRTVLLDGDLDRTFNTSPSWSPDGQSIVFVRLGRLFEINVDGTGVRPVTDAPGAAFAPDWNPAGP